MGQPPLVNRLPEPERRWERFAQEGEGVDPEVLATPGHAVQRRRRPTTAGPAVANRRSLGPSRERQA
jgi:hypothetical protein